MGRSETPELGPFAIWLDWFSELSTCRKDGEAPIPFTDIHLFATIKEIEDFEEFLYIIRRMDDAFLKANKDGNKHSNNSNSK